MASEDVRGGGERLRTLLFASPSGSDVSKPKRQVDMSKGVGEVLRTLLFASPPDSGVIKLKWHDEGELTRQDPKLTPPLGVARSVPPPP